MYTHQYLLQNRLLQQQEHYIYHQIYLKYISEKELTEQRIKKLDGVSDTILLEIADLIRKEGRAAYQESMLGEYLNGITLK